MNNKINTRHLQRQEKKKIKITPYEEKDIAHRENLKGKIKK